MDVADDGDGAVDFMEVWLMLWMGRGVPRCIWNLSMSSFMCSWVMSP